jgi:two-component system cell cycle sensor histidine kinase/response regulator CckA
VLREAGYAIRVARDGSEALKIAEEQWPFHLCVVDVVLPEMRGDELARRLRQRDPATKVLYFTGFSDRLFEDRAVLWKGEAFLEKPVTRKDLLDAASLILFGNLQGPRRS